MSITMLFVVRISNFLVFRTSVEASRTVKLRNCSSSGCRIGVFVFANAASSYCERIRNKGRYPSLNRAMMSLNSSA